MLKLKQPLCQEFEQAITPVSRTEGGDRRRTGGHPPTTVGSRQSPATAGGLAGIRQLRSGRAGAILQVDRRYVARLAREFRSPIFGSPLEQPSLERARPARSASA